MKKSLLWLALAAVLALTACGADTGENADAGQEAEQGQNQEETKQAEAQDSDSTAAGVNLAAGAEDAGMTASTAAVSTWEDAIGGSGEAVIEYAESTLDGVGERVSRITLLKQSGVVWRTMEYSLSEGAAGDEVIETVVTTNSVGQEIYRLNNYYRLREGELTILSSSGMNLLTEEQSSQGTYADAYGAVNGRILETSSWSEMASGAAFWCISTYDGEGRRSQVTEYYSDGMILGVWNYSYDGEYLELDRSTVLGKNLYMLAKTNDEGQITGIYEIEYVDGESNAEKTFDSDPLFTMEYDEAGNLVRRIGYSMYGSTPYLQTFEYREDGSLSRCTFDGDSEKERSAEPSTWDSSFRYDEDGNLLTALYGDLTGSRSADDIVLTAYEYYENGMVAAVRGYGEYQDSLRLHQEYTYDENGLQTGYTLINYHDYSDPDGGTYSIMKISYENGLPKRRVTYSENANQMEVLDYDENGEKSGASYRMDYEEPYDPQYSGQYDYEGEY